MSPLKDRAMSTTKLKGECTVADYFATPEGERWELIDGVLYQMAAAPNTKHQDASRNLLVRIEPHVSDHLLGAVYDAPYAVLLPGESAVEPDLLFVRTERLHIFTSRACEGPPDLVVEILSPSNTRHDLERKRELYARHGIPEYWMLDTERETVRALTEPVNIADVGTYTAERIYVPGDILTTDIIPELAIPVTDIFAPPRTMRVVLQGDEG